MNEFEKILQECLLALDQGESTLDECLNRYPNYAAQLEPILLTTLDLDHGREARPSPAFKARVRARLTQEIQSNPRRSIWSSLIFMRMAVSFAVVMLALLIAGTAYAQMTLPGEAFYDWKLTSENIWRAVSPDPVETDLALSGRRAKELIALGNSSEQYAQAVEAYQEVITRLELEMDAGDEARVRSVLESQIEELNNVGITLPHLEQTPLPNSSSENPTVTPEPTSVIPEVNPTLPIPTILPKIDPTIEIPPPIR